MNWRRSIVATTLALPLPLILLTTMLSDFKRIPLLGQPAPEFELAALESEGLAVAPEDSVRLADYLGGITVINFWASWCPPCRAEHADLISVANAYKDSRVSFVGILFKDSPAAARRWLDELGEAYPTGIDTRARTAIDYGVGAVPETFVLGPDGRIRYKHVGPVSSQKLAEEIERVMLAQEAGETP